MFEAVAADPSKAAQRKIRCAVYTRKSTEEGLEQDFNSLQAQREACEATIASQRHEGWVLLPQAYDDGGISGGHMNRPAVQQLLADIDAGLVDQIVVYKVDLLTRSLDTLSDRFFKMGRETGCRWCLLCIGHPVL